MSASFYRSVALSLDRIAVEVEECDAMLIAPSRRRLPDVLQGAATPFLVDQLRECSDDLAAAAALLREGATAARQRAATIESALAAAAEAAAEAAAAASAPPASDEGAAAPLLVI